MRKSIFPMPSLPGNNTDTSGKRDEHLAIWWTRDCWYTLWCPVTWFVWTYIRDSLAWQEVLLSLLHFVVEEIYIRDFVSPTINKPAKDTWPAGCLLATVDNNKEHNNGKRSWLTQLTHWMVLVSRQEWQCEGAYFSKGRREWNLQLPESNGS